jgi:hypothetical protein
VVKEVGGVDARVMLGAGSNTGATIQSKVAPFEPSLFLTVTVKV